MRQRNLKRGAIAVAALIAIIFVVQIMPSQADRLVAQAESAVRAGDIDTADHALAELAALTNDSIDLTSIVSMRLAISVARIARDHLLASEYFALASAYPEEHTLYEELNGLGEQFIADMRKHMDELMQSARTYQGQHYQSGLKLKSPLRGTLSTPIDDPQLDEAYARLAEGDTGPEAKDMLHETVSRAVVGVVLGFVVVQDEQVDPETISLAGSLDLAELLWLVGANATEPLFAQWCFEKVLEETDRQPDHPARQRAFDALEQIR